MRRVKIGSRGQDGKRWGLVHYVYTKAEAETSGIPYLEDWREVTEEGQWVLSDDGHVVQVLKISGANSSKRFIRTSVGSYVINERQKMDTSPRECRYSLSGKQPMGKNRPVRITPKHVEWATRLVMGQDPREAYKQIWGSSSKSGNYISQVMYRFLRDEGMKALIKEQLKPLLTEVGITENFVLSGYKNLFENSQQDQVKKQCLDAMADLLGLNESKTPSLPSGGFPGFGSAMRQIESGETEPEPLPVGFQEVETLEETDPEDQS